MARPKGSGLEKDVPFTLRFEKPSAGNVRTKGEFEKRANKAELSMNEFAIRKIFDEPIEKAVTVKKIRGRPRKN